MLVIALQGDGSGRGGSVFVATGSHRECGVETEQTVDVVQDTSVQLGVGAGNDRNHLIHAIHRIASGLKHIDVIREVRGVLVGALVLEQHRIDLIAVTRTVELAQGSSFFCVEVVIVALGCLSVLASEEVDVTQYQVLREDASGGIGRDIVAAAGLAVGSLYGTHGFQQLYDTG